MRTSKRRTCQTIETLENRQLLAGDLIAHWSASDLSEDLEDGSTITAWIDSIGGKSAAADGSPELVDSAFGGRPAVRFDQDGEFFDGFKVARTESPLTDANDFSLIAVFPPTQMI